jgi:hypothetical protein
MQQSNSFVNILTAILQSAAADDKDNDSLSL